MSSDTRSNRNELTDWLEDKSVSDEQIGALVREYILESQHQSWDAWSKPQIRAIQELLADINRSRIGAM